MEKMAKYPYIEGSKDCCPCAPTIPDWVKMLFDAIDHFYPETKTIKEEDVCRYREIEEGVKDAS